MSSQGDAMLCAECFICCCKAIYVNRHFLSTKTFKTFGIADEKFESQHLQWVKTTFL